MNDREYLKDTVSKLNIELTDDMINLFMRFYEMLTETNKVMNLTAITEYKEVVIRHFADSLSLVNLYDISDKEDIKIIDIGTGAGFPGIPLKIAFPSVNITLLDSLGKRISFLEKVIDELKLNSSGSIHAVHSRAEDHVKEPGIRESFDLAVSRAVADLSVLSEYALPYVRVGGCFIPYKSDRISDEIGSSAKAVDILGGDIGRSVEFVLPDSDIHRTLTEIKKTRPTPDKYPRKAGLPTKKPIK